MKAISFEDFNRLWDKVIANCDSEFRSVQDLPGSTAASPEVVAFLEQIATTEDLSGLLPVPASPGSQAHVFRGSLQGKPSVAMTPRPLTS